MLDMCLAIPMQVNSTADYQYVGEALFDEEAPLAKSFAARIGRIVAFGKRVILESGRGCEQYLEELEDDPLPRNW